MIGFLYSVGGVIVVLGTLVLVHEWGHYAVAKLCGVRVEVFSLGFGKRLWGFKRGDTDYRLSALPFGGYVKMSGENPLEEHEGHSWEFNSHPRWQRFLIALAGPAMNALFAFVLLTVVFMFHYEDAYYLRQPSVIGWVEPSSPAANAGLQPGDRIVKLDEVANPDWDTTIRKIILTGTHPLSLVVQRGDTTFARQLSLNTNSNNVAEVFGAFPLQTFTVRTVLPDGAAAAAGLKVGDELVSINGAPLVLPETFIESMQKTKDQPLSLVVKRSGATMHLTVRPMLREGQGYRIGVLFAPLTRVEKLPFPRAVSASLSENGSNTLVIFGVLRGLVTKQISVKQMSGVVGIAQQSGEAAQAGWFDLARLMALISVNLGIVNLMPIPILDGGLILLLFIEGLLRRDIKREVKEMVYQVALVFILLFFGVVMYNDITRTALGRFLHLG